MVGAAPLTRAIQVRHGEFTSKGGPPLAAAKYYSPRIDRDLITHLYHAAKTRRVPMTRLTSALVREGLGRLGAGGNEGTVIREEPPASDPRGHER
jgi:hypothetical protein